MPASAKSPLHRLVFALRHEPPRSVAFKVLSEFGYRRLLLLARPLDATLPGTLARVPLSFGLLEAGDADEYARFRPGAPPGDALARWRAGHLCFAARHERRIVGACWSAPKNAWAEYLACAVRLEPDDVYFFDAYTDPAYRGKGVAPALCRAQLAYFASLGYRRAIRLTLPENVAALHAHAKSGFAPTGMVRRIKLGPWQRVIWRVAPAGVPIP